MGKSHQLWLVVLLLLAGCKEPKQAPPKEPEYPSMHLSSSAFAEGEAIPKQYTGEGKDVSPPLIWSDQPAGTESFALICDDPDAPRPVPWVHWVMFGIPADVHELPEGVPTQGQLPSGARQGKNDFGNTGYGGPMPPRGPAHRYYFKLYALDGPLNLQAGATKQQIEQAMKGHILAQGTLMGKYQR
jgi:Raf kinase inhibitor-like YbhB/YbcL family protein